MITDKTKTAKPRIRIVSKLILLLLYHYYIGICLSNSNKPVKQRVKVPNMAYYIMRDTIVESMVTIRLLVQLYK